MSQRDRDHSFDARASKKAKREVINLDSDSDTEMESKDDSGREVKSKNDGEPATKKRTARKSVQPFAPAYRQMERKNWSERQAKSNSAKESEVKRGHGTARKSVQPPSNWLPSDGEMERANERAREMRNQYTQDGEVRRGPVTARKSVQPPTGNSPMYEDLLRSYFARAYAMKNGPSNPFLANSRPAQNKENRNRLNSSFSRQPSNGASSSSKTASKNTGGGGIFQRQASDKKATAPSSNKPASQTHPPGKPHQNGGQTQSQSQSESKGGEQQDSGEGRKCNCPQCKGRSSMTYAQVFREIVWWQKYHVRKSGAFIDTKSFMDEYRQKIVNLCQGQDVDRIIISNLMIDIVSGANNGKLKIKCCATTIKMGAWTEERHQALKANMRKLAFHLHVEKCPRHADCMYRYIISWKKSFAGNVKPGVHETAKISADDDVIMPFPDIDTVGYEDIQTEPEVSDEVYVDERGVWM